MSDKVPDNDFRFAALKSEVTRQRWALFHTAIAVAKQSNAEAMEEAWSAEQNKNTAPEPGDALRRNPEPLLSIAR